MFKETNMLKRVSIAPGQNVMIGELTDDQLIIMTRGYIRTLNSIRQSCERSQNVFSMAVRGGKVLDPQQVERIITRNIDDICPYLAEVFLRDLPESGAIRGELREALQRGEAIPRVKPMLFVDFQAQVEAGLVDVLFREVIDPEPESDEGQLNAQDRKTAPQAYAQPTGRRIERVSGK
jgi:hypothetical protein